MWVKFRNNNLGFFGLNMQKQEKKKIWGLKVFKRKCKILMWLFDTDCGEYP